MQRSRWSVVAALATCGMLASTGCVTAGQATQELEEAAFFYHRDLRWQRYSQAANHLEPKLRERFLDHCTAIEGTLNIESLDLVDVQLDENNEGALLRVRVNYLQSPSTSLQSRVVKERWERVDGTWRLMHGAWPLPDGIDPTAPPGVGEVSTPPSTEQP